MGLLEGKIAVITGAGSGMGRASCQVFVREGAKVVAADISGSGKTGITIRAKPGAHIVIEDGRFVLLPSNANLPLTNTINTNRKRLPLQ